MVKIRLHTISQTCVSMMWVYWSPNVMQYVDIL